MKILMLVFILCGILQNSKAQKLLLKDVPTAVKSNFSKQYPSVKDVDWSKDGENYEAEYEVQKNDRSVTYNQLGQLIETEMEISPSALPKPIMEYIKKNYKEDEVEEASKITNAEGVITYEAEVKKTDLIFDSKGSFLKSIKN